MIQPTDNPQAEVKPDNPWNYKPWWCQPWSIVLTGVGIISGSWLFFHKWWLTLIVGIPISAWMGYFLLLWPELMRQSGLLEQYHQLAQKQNQN